MIQTLPDNSMNKISTKVVVRMLIPILIGLASARIKSCPSFQDIMEDCSCDELRREVHCKDIMNPHSLHSIMKILSEFPLYLFKISNSILIYIPTGIFKRVRIETLEIYESEILGWESENGSLIFEGIEDSLKTIRMYKTTGIRSWKWSVFSTLRKLKFFSIRRGDVEHVDKDFSLVAPKSLEELHLDYVNIKNIHPEAFSNHENLIVLSISGNQIEEIKRSILPNPAKELRYLTLIDNRLKNLPNDMFIGMPNLVGISLVNNTIRFLSEELFTPLMGRGWGMYITDPMNKINIRRGVWILIPILIGLALARKESCPSFQDIMGDCSCDELKREVHCKNIMNPHSLHSIMKILSDFPLHLFKISNSILAYIPRGIFKRARIETLEIYESKILGWESENGSLIFEGIEDSLKTIKMYKTTGISFWKWSVFSTLRKLECFSITRGDIKRIGKDFSVVAPKSLKELHLDYDNIKKIHPKAFSNHENLVYLSISGNQIEEIKRSMFPNPAKKLRHLTLIDNRLKNLPNNMFIGMPSLFDISLVNNTIRFLPEELFAPLMGRKWVMYINDNDLYCCSDMKWIINKKIRKQIMGKCKYPQIEKDKKISQLEDFDFTHGLC